MPPWRILLVCLIAGVWGVSGGPPTSTQASQKPSSRASIIFPYDDFNQFTSVGSSYYGAPSLYSPEQPVFPSAGPSGYGMSGLSLSPTASDVGPGTRTYIFPQEEIIMGSAASHSPQIYYADPPSKLSGYAEFSPPGYRTSYSSPKYVYTRDAYKPNNYDALPSNYGLHPAVASNINRLRKPFYAQMRERPRYPSAQPPYFFPPPYKKFHMNKYPVKEIPNPDVINNALISSPFKSKYYKPRPPSHDEPEAQHLYDDQPVKRPKKKHPHMELNFEIQPSVELDIDGGVIRGKKGYEYDSEKHQSAPQAEYYKYQDQEKPYKTSYDSDKELYGKTGNYKRKLKRPASYDETAIGYDNYETNYRLEHPDPDNYDDYNGGPVNPFADDSDSHKYGGATSYVSITKPRVIGFKTLRDRESQSEHHDLQKSGTDSSDEDAPEESPVLSYKPASSSVSNWTPINPPAGRGVVPARSYEMQAPNLASNKRAGTVTDDTIETDYDSRFKLIESRPIMGKPYKSSDTNINKSDNSEGVVSAVMFFKQ